MPVAKAAPSNNIRGSRARSGPNPRICDEGRARKEGVCEVRCDRFGFLGKDVRFRGGADVVGALWGGARHSPNRESLIILLPEQTTVQNKEFSTFLFGYLNPNLEILTNKFLMAVGVRSVWGGLLKVALVPKGKEHEKTSNIQHEV